MRILGIDPGLRVTGYGLVEAAGPRMTLLEAGVIRCGLGRSLPDRLHELHAGLREVLIDARPAAIALEDLFAHPRFPRTAIIMGHVCGVIWLLALTVARWMAKADPQLTKVYRRNLQYVGFYPAFSRPYRKM